MPEILGPAHPDDDVVEILHRIERKVDAGESLPAELSELLASNMGAFVYLMPKRHEYPVTLKLYQSVDGILMIIEEATGWILWRHFFGFSQRRVIPAPRSDG